MPIVEHACPVAACTRGPRCHFFGYYDSSPWDGNGRLLLALETAAELRYMHPSDEATIGVIDTAADDAFRPLATTTAWNWQQGAQATWVDGQGDDAIAFNVRAADGTSFHARILQLASGQTRDLPMPFYALTGDCRTALCIDYRRLRYTHPTIGYAVDDGPAPVPDPHPADDGLFAMDVASGATTLILDLERLVGIGHHPSMDGAVHWITHPTPNPSGTRVAFLHRYAQDVSTQRLWSFRLVTVGIDGSDVQILQHSVSPHLGTDASAEAVRRAPSHSWSHPHWHNDHEAMCWGVRQEGAHYYLFGDGDGRVSVLGADCLTRNGHYTFSPVDHDWMLSDTYPDADGVQTLFLYRMSTGTRYDIARFGTDPTLNNGHLRCDLHPRWSRDGRTVCVDSAHDGTRQMYLVDVSSLTTQDDQMIG